MIPSDFEKSNVSESSALLLPLTVRAAPTCEMMRLAADLGEAGLAMRAIAAVVERADTALVEAGCLTMLLAAATVMRGVGEWAAAAADTRAGDALAADALRLLLSAC